MPSKSEVISHIGSVWHAMAKGSRTLQSERCRTIGLIQPRVVAIVGIVLFPYGSVVLLRTLPGPSLFVP